MNVGWSRSLKHSNSDADEPNITNLPSSKHAELMERRRASQKAPEDASKSCMRRIPSQISEEPTKSHSRRHSLQISYPSSGSEYVVPPQPLQMQLDLEMVLSQISMLLHKVDCVSDQVATCLDDTAALKVLCQPRYDGPGPTLLVQSPSSQVFDLADSGGVDFTSRIPRHRSSPQPVWSSFHSTEAGSIVSVDDSSKSKDGKNGSDENAKKTGEDRKHGADVEAKKAGEDGKKGSDNTSKEAAEDGKNGSDENTAKEVVEEEVDEKEEGESGDSIGSPFEGGAIWSEDSKDRNQKNKHKDAGGDSSSDASADAAALVQAGEASLGTAPPPPPPLPPGAEVPECQGQPSDGSSPRRNNSKGKRGLSMEYLNGINADLQREAGTALRRVRKRRPLSIKVWSFLEDPDSMRGGRFTMNAISAMIIVSAIIPVVQTMDPPPLQQSEVTMLEVVFDLIFALEVVVRFLTCPNRMAFCLDGCNFVDIAAGVLVLGLRSFSASNFAQADSKSGSVLLSLMCAVPVLRLLKLLRRFDDFHLILKAFRLASEALPVLLFILSVIVLVFASLIYVLEPRSNIESLPKALWMTVVTVGTVGYGDVVPVSPWGSLVTAAMIVVSALYMSIPVGIVGKAFSDVWDDRDKLLMIHRARNRFLERGYKAQDIPAMFCSFDQDGDGELDLPEFMAMMHKMQVALGTDRMVELFLSFDSDGSGGIDDAEFVRALFPACYAQIYGSRHGIGGTTGG